MIIADLVSPEPDSPRLGRVYLSTAPFPGDVVRSSTGDWLVVRRVFLDLGSVSDPDRLSLELKVRPA